MASYTKIYFWNSCGNHAHERDTKMLHIYDKNIHTYLFVQYIRVFKRCRIGNDFVSRRFTFPHIFHPWDWIEWYEDQTWLLIDSRKESWTKHNFSPIFRAFFWGNFPLDHGPKYVLQHFQFKRVNKFMRLSIFHSRKCLSLAVGCEMCLCASFSTRFCFYFSFIFRCAHIQPLVYLWVTNF